MSNIFCLQEKQKYFATFEVHIYSSSRTFRRCPFLDYRRKIIVFILMPWLAYIKVRIDRKLNTKTDIHYFAD